MNKPNKKNAFDSDHDVHIDSIGHKINLLIVSNLKNWEGKEFFFNSKTPIDVGNKHMYDSFQANKLRNAMITEINSIVHQSSTFHFRNYHNY